MTGSHRARRGRGPTPCQRARAGPPRRRPRTRARRARGGRDLPQAPSCVRRRAAPWRACSTPKRRRGAKRPPTRRPFRTCYLPTVRRSGDVGGLAPLDRLVGVAVSGVVRGALTLCDPD